MMVGNGHHKLVLASASEARQRLLANAGLDFSVVPSSIDEQAIREALQQDHDAIAGEDLAEVLARAKAQEVSEREPGAIVIGGDQVLSLGDRLFAKPRSDDEIRAQLLDLRGQTHALHSAVAIAEGGEVSWVGVDTAYVTFRTFSATFLGRYMAMAGSSIRDSVGCYHLEGPGVQLMEKVSGDAFTILGMPLFALLEELRKRGHIDS